jgi:hypothetical protein
LDTYSEMGAFYRNVIAFLYDGKVKNLTTEKISVKAYKEKSRDVSGWNKNSGAYIFLENRVPVYIGKAGTGKGNLGFLGRINQELRAYGADSQNQNRKANPSNTLSRRIQEIDCLLDTKIKTDGDYSIKKINTFNMIFIKTGEKGDKESASALESVLIAVFHPKYNG